MPVCRLCKEEFDKEEMVPIKYGNRKVKVCEDCAERAEEEALVAEESESVVQNMMGFKGRR
jgi:ribosome-binding protein aMBF1 (putative translation factor)